MILALAWLHTPVSGWDLAGCALIVIMVLLVTQREEEAPCDADSASGAPQAIGARPSGECSKTLRK